MKIDRMFVPEGSSPYAGIKFENRHCSIKSAKGDTLFSLDGVFPDFWSQTACDIVASKYFYRGHGIQEHRIDDCINRIVSGWVQAGFDNDYFDSHTDGDAFRDEMTYMLIHQMGAPNSPQWFNTGVFNRYDVVGTPQGHWRVNPETREVAQVSGSYQYPQVHACYIQSVDDTLVGPNGITSLLEREARLFKFGSGTGTNFSRLRSKGEPLANGGTAGGIMGWLKMLDAAAGAVKSGGTTRKAAKMVVLDIDHPEVIDFINWKVKEEWKVRAMVAGHDLLTGTPPEEHAPMGLHLDFNMNGAAYQTVSGQNANNTVRIPDSFMRLLQGQSENMWAFESRADCAGPTKIGEERVGVIWDLLCNAAWACADPGVHFSDNINNWNTCAESGQIRASNPCSEYMFLDDTACNLASLNLCAFFNQDTRSFKVEEFEHACRLWTIMLEISVAMASYPSQEIAERSFQFRTLGLGFTNLGAMLMRMGVPYGSQDSCFVAGVVSSLMTGTAYLTSVELAKDFGPFELYQTNRTSMLRVLSQHRAFMCEDWRQDYLDIRGGALPATHTLSGRWDEIAVRAGKVWNEVVAGASEFGVRNAQVTCIAPTGTIALAMDCDTTGIEPEFAIVKTKAMSDGGVLQMVSPSLSIGLKHLGYTPSEVKLIRERLVADGGHWESASQLLRDSAHLAVFRCAVGGPATTLSPMQHMRVMEAVQPFISGAISKTVNLPGNATVAEIGEVLRYAWAAGLKAVAVYRDGCKGSQPLNTGKLPANPSGPSAVVPPLNFVTPDGTIHTLSNDFLSHVVLVPASRELPKTRHAVTHKVRIGNNSCFITVGHFDDGTPGEIFLRVAKAGSTMHGLCECLGRVMSLALQSGVGMRSLVRALAHVSFPPNGLTDDKSIPLAKSLADYMARWLEQRYLGGPGETPTTPGDVGAAPEDPRGSQGRGDRSPGPGGPVAGVGEICSVCGWVMEPNGRCFQCVNCGFAGGCG